MSTSQATSIAPGPVVPGLGPRRSLTRRRVLAIGIAAVLIVAGALGAYLLLRPGPANLPPTFREAEQEVNATAAGIQGGGWTALSAFGLDERTGSTISVALVVSRAGSTCTAGAVGSNSVPTSLSVPSYSGSFGAGRAPFWVFLVRQASSGPFMLVQVSGGSTAPIALLSGSACTENLSAIDPIPTPFVNSPKIAHTAWTGSGGVNGSAFVEGDPAIDTLVMLATGTADLDGYSFTGWAIEYAPCGPFLGGTLSSEATYAMLFSATGASVAAASSTTECPTG